MLEYPFEIQKPYNSKNKVTHSYPRKWTQQEIDWVLEKRKEGYSYNEIATALERTKTSVEIKVKRLGKKNDNYNDKYVEEKYNNNKQFLEDVEKANTLLDLYCGVKSYWKNNHNNISVSTNDKDKKIKADTNMDALKRLCLDYSQNKKYDIIDLDPYGSAYECFDLAIKMAKKGIVITYGEMGHKRWKRLDFVNKRYNINTLEEFSIEKLIEQTILIGKQNKKLLTPKIIMNKNLISRVHFEITEYKEGSQWASSNEKD